MNGEVNISLNNIRNTKTVNINGVGVIHARKLGAGEQLDLSVKLRRLGKLIQELSKIDFMQFNEANPEDIKKIEKLNKKVESITNEIEDIKRFEFHTYKRCLTDDKNGEVVDVIMNTLTDEERTELFKQIFGEVKPISSTEEINLEDKDV